MEKINYLQERVDNLSSIIGEDNITIEKQNKTISESIPYIKSKIDDNSNTSSEIIQKSKQKKIIN